MRVLCALTILCLSAYLEILNAEHVRTGAEESKAQNKGGTRKGTRKYYVHPASKTLLTDVQVAKVPIMQAGKYQKVDSSTAQKAAGVPEKTNRRKVYRISKIHRKHHKRSHRTTKHVTFSNSSATNLSHRKNLPLGPHGHGPHGGRYRF